jgi:hypothetical protein
MRVGGGERRREVRVAAVGDRAAQEVKVSGELHLVGHSVVRAVVLGNGAHQSTQNGDRLHLLGSRCWARRDQAKVVLDQA